MSSDAELGHAIRQLVEHVAGPGSCSSRMIYQEIAKACEEELRVKGRVPGNQRDSLQRSRYESPIRNMSQITRITDIRKRYNLNSAGPVIPARRSPVRPTSPPPPPPILSRGGFSGMVQINEPVESILSPVAGLSYPQKMLVICDEKPNINGEYQLLSITVNSFPVWACQSLRLYSTRAGYWMFTASPSGPDRDTGLVESMSQHSNSPPHLVPQWQYFSSRWMPSNTSVTVIEQFTEEGPAHDVHSVVR